MGLPRLDRRSLLKYASVSGLASLATACLSQNAPTTAVATASPGVGAPTATAVQQQTITLKMQSTWVQNDPFHIIFSDWAKRCEEMSNGRLKIDLLPVNAVTNNNGLIDAVSAGTLDGGHGVPAYWYGKNHAVSLVGTGPKFGMSGEMWLAWYYYGGGQDTYQDIIQKTLKLNVVSFFHMPMPNQPLGWFKKEISGPDDFKGIKFRTVGLATGLYQDMGATVIATAGAEIASALDRGLLDAAEYNNTTADIIYGFPDSGAKFVYTQSYHQPSEILELVLNKTKYESLPKDLQAIMKWTIVAGSADGKWKMIDMNSTDYAKLLAKGIKYQPEPQSIKDAQLKAWDKIIAAEANNPDFVKLLDSQKKWAQRVFPWASVTEILEPDAVSYNWFFGKR